MMNLGIVLMLMTHAATPAQNSPASAAVTSSVAPTSQPAPQATGFLDKTLRAGNESYAYSIFVPAEHTTDRPWPVILFLHGSGERGADGLLQTEVGIATAIRRNRAVCPAIVVMPQCRPGQLWTNEMAEMALKCLDQTAAEYNLDPDRTLLTGLSLGGFGAWLLGERAAQRFAAVVPICGFYGQPNVPVDAESLARLGASLRNIPVWCFHGALDTAVPVDRAREITGALRNAGGNVKYTEYADGPHDVWSRAYADPELWKWMLAQRRAAAPAPASQPAPKK